MESSESLRRQLLLMLTDQTGTIDQDKESKRQKDILLEAVVSTTEVAAVEDSVAGLDPGDEPIDDGLVDIIDRWPLQRNDEEVFVDRDDPNIDE
ncbi:uncharacterized protein PG986_008411 [Apiospora aurea]|uniref:Uncharacterized protein n=1 Tax=Apiospora aurea TaxID=335848 RepID=A0ABR1QFP6_9PEZI